MASLSTEPGSEGPLTGRKVSHVGDPWSLEANKHQRGETARPVIGKPAEA